MLANCSDASSLHVFVDESIHDAHGFIVVAFVFATSDVFGVAIATALEGAGLRPFLDEFKSGERMEGNERLQRLRGQLLQLIAREARIAVLVVPTAARSDLGRHALEALDQLPAIQDLGRADLHVSLDTGFFRSLAVGDASPAATALRQRGVRVDVETDSRLVLGLQAADVVAHTVGQVIREHITRRNKVVAIGGPGTGYAVGEVAPLAWSLLMTIRYAFFVGEPDDDPARPDRPLLGHGVLLADDLPADVAEAARGALGSLWLGCIH